MDKRRAETKLFHIGDRVFPSTKYIKLRIPCKKLGPKYLGPFTVTQLINPVTVMLKLPPLIGKIHPVFHSSLLKPVEQTTPAGHPGPITRDEYELGLGLDELDDILDSKVTRGKLKYLVKWKGYPFVEVSWVDRHDIKVPRLLRWFHRKYPHKPRDSP